MPNSGKDTSKLKGYMPMSQQEAASRPKQGPSYANDAYMKLKQSTAAETPKKKLLRTIKNAKKVGF